VRFTPFYFAALLVAACDYAPAEKVRQLSRDVDVVKSEQRVLRTQVESTTDNQRSLQTSVAAIGAGFNVLTESVVQHDQRVDSLEVTTERLREETARVAQKSENRQPEKRRPNTIGMYLGTRLDTRTLEEKTVRVQWCEAAEGMNGYVAVAGVEPNYAGLQCWRYGDVAIFRNDSGRGAQVQCLRVIDDDDQGNLQALDCADPAMLYRLSLR
jgi:hypothetical protein